jgi:hypothetical protein
MLVSSQIARMISFRLQCLAISFTTRWVNSSFILWLPPVI